MSTERAMLDLLHARYSLRVGNGPRYVIAEHVRNGAGFDASRSLDAMVLDLWPSSGLAVHGFEVKCSRGDWLRELKDPDEGRRVPAAPRLHVARRRRPRDRQARRELPKRWGLLHPGHPSGRVALLAAPAARRLRPAPSQPIRYHEASATPMPRSLMASLARSIARTAERRASAP